MKDKAKFTRTCFYLGVLAFIYTSTLFLACAFAQEADAIKGAEDIPAVLSEVDYQKLLPQKEALDKEQTQLSQETDAFNSDCGHVSVKDQEKAATCQSGYQDLQQKISNYEIALNAYEAAIKEAKTRTPVEILSTDNNSEPVKLSTTESERPLLVDPHQIEGILKKSGLKIKDVPPPAAGDPYFNKSKAVIILDALEAGKIYGKNKPSDLNVSIKYINDYLLTRDPRNMNAREAMSYLEGMHECAALYPESLPAKPLDEKVVLDHLKVPPAGQAKKWPGEKDPNAKPQGLRLPDVPVEDYVPGSEEMESLLESVSGKKTDQTSEDILKQWRQERSKALYYALREGKGDVKQAIEFMEKKIDEDLEFRFDSPARSSVNYLDGYQGYKDYEENLKK